MRIFCERESSHSYNTVQHLYGCEVRICFLRKQAFIITHSPQILAAAQVLNMCIFCNICLVLTRATQPRPHSPISTTSNAWDLLPSLPFLPPKKQTSVGIFSDQAGIIQQLIGGLPRGFRGKEPTCQYTREKSHGFDLWVRKIPWRRAWLPTRVFLPGESRGQRSLAGYSPWGRKELDTTEVT